MNIHMVMTLLQKIDKSKIMSKKLSDSFIHSVNTSREGVIISPIYLMKEHVRVPDKKYALNLNTYRNLNFIINNELKIQYKEMMKDQLKGIVLQTPLTIHYKLYWSHKSDLMNIISVVDKFFCDALQEFECIENDNVDYLTNYVIGVGGRDRGHPRVEIIFN